MTLNEFVYRNLKKGVDFDGHYGLQCVDLFRQYCQDVWDIPQPEGVTGAVDFFTKYDKKPILKKHIERLSYPANKPAEGDAVAFAALSVPVAVRSARDFAIASALAPCGAVSASCARRGASRFGTNTMVVSKTFGGFYE